MAFKLSQQEGEFLVKLARKAAEEYVKTRRTINVPEDTPKKLLQPCGVFITINSIKDGHGRLRGCIGLPYPTAPLAQAVVEAAISSATQDPRFKPLSSSELDEIAFELSALTPPEKVEVNKPIEYPSKIKVGEDGLIVEKGMFKGLLLPQVPVEWGWNEEEFLRECSVKAGLPADCWLLVGTKIYKFHAIIFEEEKPKGEIRRKIIGGK